MKGEDTVEVPRGAYNELLGGFSKLLEESENDATKGRFKDTTMLQIRVPKELVDEYTDALGDTSRCVALHEHMQEVVDENESSGSEPEDAGATA